MTLHHYNFKWHDTYFYIFIIFILNYKLRIIFHKEYQEYCLRRNPKISLVKILTFIVVSTIVCVYIYIYSYTLINLKTSKQMHKKNFFFLQIDLN